jgi:hypothetical protein
MRGRTRKKSKWKLTGADASPPTLVHRNARHYPGEEHQRHRDAQKEHGPDSFRDPDRRRSDLRVSQPHPAGRSLLFPHSLRHYSILSGIVATLAIDPAQGSTQGSCAGPPPLRLRGSPGLRSRSTCTLVRADSYEFSRPRRSTIRSDQRVRPNASLSRQKLPFRRTMASSGSVVGTTVPDLPSYARKTR